MAIFLKLAAWDYGPAAWDYSFAARPCMGLQLACMGLRLLKLLSHAEIKNRTHHLLLQQVLATGPVM